MSTPANALPILEPFQKLQAIFGLLPTINGIILNSLVQIDQVLPNADIDAAKIAAVTTQISDAFKAANMTLIPIEDLIPIINNFAGSILAMVEQVKAAAAGRQIEQAGIGSADIQRATS